MNLKVNKLRIWAFMSIIIFGMMFSNVQAKATEAGTDGQVITDTHEIPTTAEPTTAEPTTEAPTTAAPTTEAPTTAEPTTEAPTTEAPTTAAPTTEAPTTEAPTTAAPTTQATTVEDTTAESTTKEETTEEKTTEAAKSNGSLSTTTVLLIGAAVLLAILIGLGVTYIIKSNNKSKQKISRKPIEHVNSKGKVKSNNTSTNNNSKNGTQSDNKDVSAIKKTNDINGTSQNAAGMTGAAAAASMPKQIKEIEYDLDTFLGADILPLLSNGVKNLDDAMDIIDIMDQMRVNNIVITPEYIAGKKNVTHERIASLYEQLTIECRDEYEYVRLFMGSIVNYNSGALEAVEKGKAFTVNNSKYVLLKFKKAANLCDIEDGVDEFVKAGYKPVLMNVETLEDIEEIDEYYGLVKMGAYLMLNLDNTSGINIKRRNKIREVIAEELFSFVNTNPKNVEKITAKIDYLKENCRDEYTEKLLKINPRSLLADKDITV